MQKDSFATATRELWPVKVGQIYESKPPTKNNLFYLADHFAVIFDRLLVTRFCAYYKYSAHAIRSFDGSTIFRLAHLTLC